MVHTIPYLTRRVSRRQALLAATAAAAALGLLTACGGTTAATATSATIAATSAATATSTASSAGAGSKLTSSATAASQSNALSAASSSAGSTTAAPTTSLTVTTSAPAASKGSAAKSTVTYWVQGPGSLFDEGLTGDDPLGGQLRPLRQKFEAANAGVTLTGTVEPSLTKFKTQVAAGTPPDVSYTQSYVQTTWGVTGVVQAVDHYIATSKNVKPADVWKFKWEEVVWQGKTYAVPYGFDNRVVWANSDLYQKVGLDPTKLPATWSDMEATVSKTFTQQGGQITQLSWDPFGGSGGQYVWLVPFWQLGGNFTASDGSTVTIANDQGTTAMDWVIKVYDLQSGYDAVKAYAKSAAGGDGVKLFSSSHTVHLYGTIATKAEYLDKVPDLKYTVAQWPLPPNGKLATYAGGGAFCLPTGAKNPDGAFALIDYFYQPDVQLTWAIDQLRVPPSMSVANSTDYTRNDPLFELTVQAMPFGRFIPSMPGAEDVFSIFGADIVAAVSKKMTVQAALEDAQQRSQLAINKYRT